MFLEITCSSKSYVYLEKVDIKKIVSGLGFAVCFIFRIAHYLALVA